MHFFQDAIVRCFEIMHLLSLSLPNTDKDAPNTDFYFGCIGCFIYLLIPNSRKPYV